MDLTIVVILLLVIFGAAAAIGGKTGVTVYGVLIAMCWLLPLGMGYTAAIVVAVVILLLPADPEAKGGAGFFLAFLVVLNLIAMI